MAEAQLNLPEILVMHELVLERFGGMRGITEEGFGKLEAALAAPDVTMFGVDLYPDLQSKAGVLFFRLVRSHGFSDGNKRVALLALIDVLERNGMRLAADDDELYAFVMAAATHSTREEVTDWIEARLQHG